MTTSFPSPSGSRPRILITRRLPAEVEARLAARYEILANGSDVPLGRAGILAGAEGADAILTTVGDPIDRALIEALPASVRAIATFSAGTDHIDKAAAREKGIAVTNTPDVLTDATAEIALLLMLGAARRAHEGQGELRDGRWSGWRPMHLQGTQLSGKRLGIVGFGRIGQATAERARAFRMEIHYTGRRRLPEEMTGGAVYHADLDALLGTVDVLSLHCPSTAETRGMIGDRRLRLMRPGSILVNTARGDLIDDEALIKALSEGRIGAAGLDVFTGEPKLHPGYLALPNAFLLPHLGSATVETRAAMGHRAADNLDAFFDGLVPPDQVV